MAFPQDLLEQAQHLANREPRKPKQASLRRAVSTAYYALFHLLITEAAKNWRRPAERTAFGGIFEHRRMKDEVRVRKPVTIWNHSKTVPPARRHPTVVEEHLYFVADTFVDMQEHRHAADYDSGRRWTRVGTVELVDRVAEAFQSWKAIRKEGAAQEFLVSLLLRER